MRPSPATRRRLGEGTPSKKTPTSALPLATSHPKPRGRCNEEDMPERACGAVVETVSVAVPEPLATELGSNEQEGRGVTEGAIALQDRLTVPLKPFIGAIVIVEAADPPAANETGQSVEAVIVKSGDGDAM